MLSSFALLFAAISLSQAFTPAFIGIMDHPARPTRYIDHHHRLIQNPRYGAWRHRYPDEDSSEELLRHYLSSQPGFQRFDPHGPTIEELEKAFGSLKIIEKTENDERTLFHVHAAKVALQNLLKVLHQRVFVATLAEQAAEQHKKLFQPQVPLPDQPTNPIAQQNEIVGDPTDTNLQQQQPQDAVIEAAGAVVQPNEPTGDEQAQLVSL